MDKALRDGLRKATQSIRGLLEKEFSEQLEGTFDILIDGTMRPTPGAHLSETHCLVREKLVAAITHKQSLGLSPQAAVEAYMREAAFTSLNRFVALKMLEARGLVQECVSRGDESSGFKEFTALAPGLVQLQDKGYRLYIGSLFDEIGQEVRVLFNRRDIASLLWPRRAALLGLLELINGGELKTAWAEDETIGWIYQFYNGNDVSEMRKAVNGAAPRNSHEMAVRNQFFTPRYVVEFLTDNTLGRIWDEMNQGQTRLKDLCRYLVRRPNEIFLAPGENAPEQIPQDSICQEQLLKQPVYIPHRPLKDPREIRMLDPACGSMHFGLYAFDLFEVIYAEAWDIAYSDDARKLSSAFKPFMAFVARYADKADFLADVPCLIIEHNIHGIDIDPRAAQIAGLSLWLRAQRAWQQQKLPLPNRLLIRRSNVVCAEPMPGEKAFLDEFIAEQLSSTPEHRLLGQLLRRVFDAMKLAGEAGSLLKIEEEIAGAVAEAKQKWLAPRKFVQLSIFADEIPLPVQQELDLDVLGITDESFWEQVEEDIYAALQTYAEQAEQSGGYQRRLFADDAARGFAFIDLCRKRFDVILMNPPYGDFSDGFLSIAKSEYVGFSANIYASFWARTVSLCEHGFIGGLTSRTFLTLSQFGPVRDLLLRREHHLSLVADLGAGVLDGAAVDTCASVVSCDHNSADNYLGFFQLDQVRDKGDALLKAVSQSVGSTYWLKKSVFLNLPGKRFFYWAPSKILNLFEQGCSIESNLAQVRPGLVTGNDFRFLAFWWELPISLNERKDWFTFAKGGDYERYYADLSFCINWRDDGREVKSFAEMTVGSVSKWIFNEAFYFREGLTFPNSSALGFSARCLPRNSIISVKGQGIFQTNAQDIWILLALLNSRLVHTLLLLFNPGKDVQAGDVKQLPFGEPIASRLKQIRKMAQQILDCVRTAHMCDETSPLFSFIPNTQEQPSCSEQSSFDFQNRKLQSVASELCTLEESLEHEIYVTYGLSKDLVEEFVARADARPTPLEMLRHSLSDTCGAAAGVYMMISFALGVAFGRWDIRFATGEKLPLDLPDPFAPLPACPPGQLQNEQGLPITHEDMERLKEGGRWDYPIEIPWDGILVDDPGHQLDIETSVHQVLQIIWLDRWETIERDACDILGVRTLHDYFLKPTGFFADHLKRYSKSRRKAPIYWLLSTKSASYSVWIYYQRFDRDTFFQVLDLVKNKLEHESGKLRNLQQEIGPNPGSSQRKAVEEQKIFVEELSGLRDEVARIAPLWNPNLNDGVIINFAPLWRLVPQNASWQKECKATWDKLVNGEYDWSHFAMHLWPERVIPKCMKDRSLAIAHGLDEVFWEENDKGKWLPLSVDAETLQNIIAERSSPGVKSALQSLLDAPIPRGATRGGTITPRQKKIPRTRNTTSTVSITDAAAISAEVDESTLNVVREAISGLSSGATKSDVLTITDLSDVDWNKAISALLASGEVTRSGERRGTRYHTSIMGESKI